MSGSSDKRLGRALALSSLALFAACTFPEHTFIEDSQFNAGGSAGTAAGAGGSSGGSGGSTGGSAGVSGNGGSTGGTSGAGAGGGGTGGVSGAGGGNGGSAGGGTENCVNGTDDDGDTKVDCEDTDCQPGHSCFPTVPGGWTGPVAIFQGVGPAPACQDSGGFPTPKHNAKAGLQPGTVQCPSCSCVTQGLTCTANFVFFQSSGCGAGSCWGSGVGCPGTAITATSGACKLQGFCQPGPAGAIVTDVTASGTCNATSSGQEQIPTPTFSDVVRACGDGPSGGKGCGTGICMPKPTAPFGADLCIFTNGDVACPAAFSTKSLAHQDFTDNRDCDPCACGALSGATCSGATIDFYTNDFCSVGKQTAAGVNQCLALSADPDVEPPLAQCSNQPADFRSLMLTATPSGGSCPATGGTVTGSVTPTGTVTICCL